MIACDQKMPRKLIGLCAQLVQAGVMMMEGNMWIEAKWMKMR
jgi:hypothetical protein